MKLKMWFRVLLPVPFICLMLLSVLSVVPLEVGMVQTDDGVGFYFHNWVTDLYLDLVVRLVLLITSAALCLLGVVGGVGIEKQKVEEELEAE